MASSVQANTTGHPRSARTSVVRRPRFGLGWWRPARSVVSFFRKVMSIVTETTGAFGSEELRYVAPFAGSAVVPGEWAWVERLVLGDRLVRSPMRA